MVLMVMLLHHLTGNTWRTSWLNAETALDEAWRVLKPGGTLLIVESCIPPWFFEIEKPALWILSRLFRSLFSHPITFQFPVQMITDSLRKKSSAIEVTQIPKGKHILQLGFKVPSVFSPIHPYGIENVIASGGQINFTRDVPLAIPLDFTSALNITQSPYPRAKPQGVPGQRA